MRGLILLIIKYAGFLSFIALEIICFWMIVRFNSGQRKIWMNSSNYFSGLLYERFDNVTKYWNLSGVADSLANENARLRAELRSARFEEDILEGSASSEKWQQHYTFTAAEVVNNSVNQLNNFLTINKGKRHGVRNRMGVISNDGIVGIVVSCGDYYSSVMSVLHKESRIASSVKRTNAFGSLVWMGSNPLEVQLNDIPKHPSLEVGDTIQTSGSSSRFPGGLEIGYVSDFDVRGGSNFYNINVKLKNDLSRIKYVYVVNNLMDADRKAVEGPDDE